MDRGLRLRNVVGGFGWRSSERHLGRDAAERSGENRSPRRFSFAP
jgi:hypothetical protein